jgi:hypothetical protein
MLEFEPEDDTPFPHKEITEAIVGSAFEATIISLTVFSTVYINDRFK